MAMVSGLRCNFGIILKLILAISMILSLAACSMKSSSSPGATPTPLSSQGGEVLPKIHTPGGIVQVEEMVIALLFLAAIVSLVSQRLRIPYTVGLVLVGVGLSLLGEVPIIMITPELILALLVPPLVFEAAFHLDFADLRRELPLVVMLAIPGVILTTILVGGLVSIGAGINISYALLFGSIIAATDPVAVVALFRSFKAPKRLQVLLEGESLLNDGTAIVLFNLMLATAVSGELHLGSSILQFFLVAGGGILVGLLLGIFVSQIIGKIDNYLIETTFTTVLAYGSYLIAEYLLGVSGVLAVVAAGLASGHIGPRGMSPTTRIMVFNFWEYLAFLANTFIFLIIGLQIDLQMLYNNAAAIGWGILAVLISRAAIVYGFSFVGDPIPFQWKNILFWGGLRGAISLALALSLSTSIPNRVQLQAMVFGVVLFTLLVEGLSMGTLIRKSGVVQYSAAHQEYELQHARAIALRAANARLSRLNHDGLITDTTWRTIKPALEQRTKELAGSIQATLVEHPALLKEELNDAWREALRAQRSTIALLFRNNIISEEIYTELIAEVDLALTDPNSTWPELEQAQGTDSDQRKATDSTGG